MARQNLENEELGGVIRSKINENFEELYDVADGLGTAATADIGTGVGQVIGTNEAKNYFGLNFEPSVKPTISSDFSRNEHKLYEQYGLEPKSITQMYDVARASTATYVDATGKIRTAGVNEPRIDFSSGQGRLLVEEARTNLVTWSEDFNQSSWELARTEIEVSSTISPSGEVDASKLIETESNNSHNLIQSVSGVGQNQIITASIFTKAAERSNLVFQVVDAGGSFVGLNVDLLSGEVNSLSASLTSHKIERLNNGWFRVIITLNTGTGSSGSVGRITVRLAKGEGTSGSNVVYLGDGTSGVYIWGAQLEQG